MNDGKRCLIFWNEYSQTMLTLIVCNAKMARLQEKIMSYALGTRDCPTKFCFREHVKTFMVVNSLQHDAPNGTQIANFLLLKKPSSSFALSDVASYIDPFVDIKQLDVLFNQITNTNMCLKQCGQPKKPFGHATTH